MADIILPSMTVREINLRYPACREVFNQYGMGGCGGTYGPPEPIDFFAQAHNVSLDDLIRALTEAAGRSDTGITESSDERANTALSRRFIKAALAITLTIGTAYGVVILTQIALGQSFSAPKLAITQAHGHAQIFGWVGLFIMGIAYYTLPKFKNLGLSSLKLANASFALMLGGIILRVIGQAHGIGALTVVSGIPELASVGIYAYLMIKLIRRSETPEFYDRFIYASIGWMALGAVANIFLSIIMLIRHTDIIPAEFNDRFLHVLVFGFITNMILGYSLRILPHFMGLRQPIEKHANTAFLLYNAGVLIKVLGFPPIISGAHELAGVLLFVYALGVFAKPASSVEIAGVDNAYTWFIRLGYAWLVATAFMVLGAGVYQAVTGNAPAHAYVGAYRHAITVGFITTMMLGVAYRVLPIFNGVDLDSPRAIRASFALIAIGNALRVGGQLATMTNIKPFYAVMGISGYLELTSLAIFSVVMWKVMADVTDPFLVDRVVRADTKVANIMDAYPDIRQVLVSAGLTHLAHLPRVPGFVTVGIAAKRHGLDVDNLVATLNQTICPTA